MHIGLALSGGGFRAALFNLGSLYRLNDFGLLPKIKQFSSVSGGSITSGLLGVRWNELNFDSQARATNFHDVVGIPILSFCGKSVDLSSALRGMVNPFSSVGNELTKVYQKELFGDATLQDFPQTPRFIINATNMQTGANFRFDRQCLHDYKIGDYSNPTVSVATAVAASSAFPPFLSPIKLRTDPGKWQQTKFARLFDRDDLRRDIVLTDGGVYDNMGLEAIWKDMDVVLVSDAGAPLPIETKPWLNYLSQSIRVIDLITEQTRALRKRKLIADFTAQVRKGTYWGITTKIGDYQLADPMTTDKFQTEQLCKIRTRLNPFLDREKDELVNWGYALADAAIRKHWPQGNSAPGSWPMPAHKL
jgi:NTE family protein